MVYDANPARYNSIDVKKVLVIDDTEEMRGMLAESLNFYGFSTLVAGDGVTGVRLARDESPDLIICDINMPALDGYQTLSALRGDDRTATIPFIFLTGATDKTNMRKGMEMGADDYLTKPFTHRELLAAVNARLEKQEEQKRQSDKKLDELRGNITLALPHELRTPLNGIMGLAAVLMEDYETISREELMQSAKYIHESALRLHRLIENFLIYSQIELMASESMMIETSGSFTPIPVLEVVPDLARKIAARYQRENDLVVDVCEAHILIPGENLAKIVEELVDNAFKFSQPGSRVAVQGELKNNDYHLTIADQGRGLSAEDIAKIGPHMQFERKTYEQQGAGLGLIIAKRLTELLSGQFNIVSQPGQGTTVRVSFHTPSH
jgi:two-component system sensor histidine kinase/response regulator